jgi:SAM-dependent methyltransferase
MKRAPLPRPLPRGLRSRVNGVEFSIWRRVGEYFSARLLEAGLPERGRVLEIGCGTGRIAWPLTLSLGPRASYLGLDVRPDAIQFCRDRIAPNDDRFRFESVDLRHPIYNPAGRLSAARWRFSKLGRFDFVFLISVLTHMDWEETVHYLGEIRGLLAPGGLCFATFFLHSPELIRRRGPRFDALFPYRTGDARFCERAFAFSFSLRNVLAACAKAGLEPARPIGYGDWSAAPVGRGWPEQDELVLRAAESPARRRAGSLKKDSSG